MPTLRSFAHSRSRYAPAPCCSRARRHCSACPCWLCGRLAWRIHGGYYGGWYGGYYGWRGGYSWVARLLLWALGLVGGYGPLLLEPCGEALLTERPPGQYESSAPPEGMATRAATRHAGPSQQPVVYPKNGQSEEQQGKDAFECHRWAVGQTGFDPTQGAGNRSAYFWAQAACLEGALHRQVASLRFFDIDPCRGKMPGF